MTFAGLHGKPTEARSLKKAGVLAAVAALLVLNAARAEESADDACLSLSGKTIRWFAPSKPGGGYDRYSRLIQPFLEDRLHARIRIENRPEAGGIVAALSIRDGRADGTVMGILNAPGLLIAGVSGNDRAPDLTQDFTTLGRIVGIQYLMLTGRGSGISSIEQLLDTARQRSILIAVRDSGSTSFLTVPVTASLLGIEYDLVTGYVGNAARALAVIRGEVDVVVLNYDSNTSSVDTQEMVPLMQVSGEPVGGLEDLPDLGIVARRRALVLGNDPDQAEFEATALEQAVGMGRIVAAPPGLSEPMAACLGDALMEVLGNEALRSAADSAQLSIAPLDRVDTRASIVRAEREVTRFEPLLREALQRVRE